MAATKELMCETGTFSGGKQRCGLALKIDDAALPVGEADALLLGAQLSVVLSYDPNGEQDGQGQRLAFDTSRTLEFVGDCPSYRHGNGCYSLRVSMPADAVRWDEVRAFVGRRCEARLRRIGNGSTAGDEDGRVDGGDEE